MRADIGKPMWIDHRDAITRIDALAQEPGQSELAARLREFHRDGFTILKGAIPQDTIDAYIADFDHAAGHDTSIMVSYGRDVFPIVGQDLKRPLTKILDTHIKLRSSHDLIFADRLSQFAQAIFEGPSLAFQGLHFEVGSTQAIHQDTAYVVIDEPRLLIASWIALEDVVPGCGELVFYPGSHRFPEYLYPDNRKYWNPDVDDHELHDTHLKRLHKQAEGRGVSLEPFLAKKGDVLFWHADLAHGGSPITNPALTRRSLVTHYTDAACTPHYFQFVSEQRRRKVAVGSNFVSSMYYDIDETFGRTPQTA
ncbi:hypothetical protein ABAC460_14150 [Asticcacaulis sp. AC460]|uniref:phytanoyl-CoA dioxygenase family protein n=1 Tax=Asticcacaulis sp. AC460 TaxID=1282360 RepID=UPI0003C3B1B3|nr:phytanoyl-CoA dioxygenase family protein [Asticcacaulis sp. AC460]ESQ88919.1 hypothetical protein ABAC460_14150 [Asticcacaulis sp. AC460]